MLSFLFLNFALDIANVTRHLILFVLNPLQSVGNVLSIRYYDKINNCNLLYNNRFFAFTQYKTLKMKKN